MDEATIDRALEAFRGDFDQIPSMFSAIKQNGKPLYKLARQGIEVEREPRPVTVHENRILEFGGDRLVLQILCSKGTYVRTIAEDLGEALGCGAHVTALRRTTVGPFHIDSTHTLAELEAVAVMADMPRSIFCSSSQWRCPWSTGRKCASRT